MPITQAGHFMNIRTIKDKVDNQERISDAEALFLFQTPDIHALGRMANTIRERWNGKNAYYIVNRHINYSNVCIDSCKFCAFARKIGKEGSFTYGIDEMLAKAKEGADFGATEFHIVGGLHPRLPYEYYLDLLRALKQAYPHILLKCFTAVEISHLTKRFRKSILEVLTDLKDAGLDFMPGGGAEMFSQTVRDEICPRKLYVDQWLDVHRTAHSLGLLSNATMLYGHVETPVDIIDHMRHLRELQDETQGLVTFIPLKYQPENNTLGGTLSTGLTDLRVHAIARIYLDNIPHIKAYWTMLGLKTAQTMLLFGADDFDGTVIDEKIVHMAGSTSPKVLTVTKIRRLILETGLIPVERDTRFKPVQREVPLPAVIA
jgi:aminodeoxyfutalosine synthase